MSFAVTLPADPPADETIDNGDFWPAVSPTDIRAAQDIDGTVTAPRLKSELIEAIASVNAELATWRAQQTAASLADIDAEEIAGKSILEHRYLRAVGCFAKAALIERMRDYDTSAEGDRKADAQATAIDDLRRDARWAIADLQGKPRTVAELI